MDCRFCLLVFCLERIIIHQTAVGSVNTLPYPSIFKDQAKLDINYIPQQLRHRETQQRLLDEFFNFVLLCPGKMTQRVILTGDVGTGKTALAHNFGANLASMTTRRQITFHYIHVNCREYSGNLQAILHKAITYFRPNFPPRGYGTEEIFATLLQILDEEQTTIVLTLDEFDSLIEKEGTNAVYKLTRIQETHPNKPQHLSFIFIMRTLEPLTKLDDSTKSTLQQNILHLERYDKPALTDILSDRVDLAFEPGVVSQDVVELIAQLSHTQTGNARFGIELLWRAGKYTDAQNTPRLEPEFVRQAIASIVPSLRRAELLSLSLHERLFLLAIARYFIENKEAYALLTQTEQTYHIICEEYNQTPNNHTQLYTYAQRLTQLGVIDKQTIHANTTRGRTTQISLPTIPATQLEKQLTESLAQDRSNPE